MSIPYQIGYDDGFKSAVVQFTSDDYQNKTMSIILKALLESDGFERFSEGNGEYRDYISRETLEKWLEKLGGVE
jgi:hypothetical protein